ncbi:transcription initiation factor IIB family protein (plasmid) [Haloterrigena salifodinae]|uniref:Transcription initiation factor IIB family protein n=1 Tax=Haloterrigena salifodinae TaxID=2675099 RepID=A0A8T8E7U4_9EURY|nr:transcription initiation factor IIB family protein [Haloterrigena salifodinae]QRV17431.1 transcription initiation factor IIB family protein [Haloterrigena salifodinae]
MATRDIYTTAFDEDVQTTATGCPDCGGSVRTTGRETVCEDCGLILEDTHLDRGPDWGRHDAQGSEKRTGAPLTPTRHDRGLSTEIGYKQDGHGNALSSTKRRQLNRLRREQSRAQWQSKAERNLAYGLGEIRRIVASLGLAESIRDQACSLFRTAQSEQLCRGRSLEAVAAASVYATTRCNGLGRARSEVAACARCDQQRLTNAYTAMNVELELPTQPIAATDRIPRLATALEVPNHVRRRALDLAQTARERGLTIGCRPSGVAAGCLYLAAQRVGLCLSQQRIADIAGTSPNTLRNRRDELLEIDT